MGVRNPKILSESGSESSSSKHEGLTEEEHEANSNVGDRPPRSSQRRSDVSDLSPIEGNDRHSETGSIPEELVDDDIVGSNPTYPAEYAKSGEKIPWEKVPQTGANEAYREESFSRNTASTTHTSVMLTMECVEEGTSDQIGGPDH